MIFGMDPMPFLLFGVICMIAAIFWLGTNVMKRLERIATSLERIAASVEKNEKYTKGTRDELKTQNTSGKLPAIIPVTDPALTAYFKQSFGTDNVLQINGAVKRPQQPGAGYTVESPGPVS